MSEQIRVYPAERELSSGKNSLTARAVLEAVNRQFTDQRVVGAKIYDQFTDSGGTCRTLSRAPLDCALDGAESVVLSYLLELEDEAPEYAVLVEELERRFEEAGVRYAGYPREAVFPVPPLMIEVDGRIDDWGTVQPLIADPIGDGSGPVSGTDIAAIYLAHDGGSLFLRYDLADGNPGTRGLYYGVGLRDTRGSWERMLFTAYDGSWSTGIDEWTGEPGRHARVSAGTVRQRDGSIEAEYNLAALEFPPGAELEVNAWLDPSRRAYDTTIPRRAILDPEQSYFVYRGTIHGKRVDGATLNPYVELRPGPNPGGASRVYAVQASFSPGGGTAERLELRFAPDVLEAGKRNRLSDAENSGDEFFIGSTIIE